VPISEEPDGADERESAVVMSPTATEGKKDILADMDAFQREIDALMARGEVEKRKSSSGSVGVGVDGGGVGQRPEG